MLERERGLTTKMAYQTPPTFVTGGILSAAQLNILSDDIEYLNGFSVSSNPAMTSVHLDVDGDAFFVIKHTQRYLHVKFRALDRCRIYYDAINVYNVDNFSGDETTTIDLNSFGLVLNQYYTLKFSLESTGDPLFVYYAYEASA